MAEHLGPAIGPEEAPSTKRGEEVRVVELSAGEVAEAAREVYEADYPTCRQPLCARVSRLQQQASYAAKLRLNRKRQPRFNVGWNVGRSSENLKNQLKSTLCPGGMVELRSTEIPSASVRR